MPADPKEQPTGEVKARSTLIGFLVLRLAALLSIKGNVLMEQVLINLIAGALGGVGAGKASPQFDLGTIGNIVSGIVGPRKTLILSNANRSYRSIAIVGRAAAGPALA